MKSTETAYSAGRGFKNSWPMFVKFPEIIYSPEIFDWCKIEDLSIFHFLIKGRQRRQNFQFFKRQFLRNGAPYGYEIWRAIRDLPEASKKYNFAFYLKL